MRKVACLALFALSACVAFTEPPATQPAAVDEAQVARLIRQLDNPLPKNREEAAKALETMGEPVVPLLEKAAESASFETRARIQDLLRALGQPLVGVIVCKLAPDAQAFRLNIKPGDIITAIEGQPIHGYAEFDKLATAMQSRSRTIDIRSGRERRTLTVEPGIIGVWLADYEDRYGQPLIAAIQAFSQDHMVEARDRMKDAQRAGMTFNAGDCRQIILALATYFSGDPDAAHALLANWVVRSRRPWAWGDLCTLLPKYHASCRHLPMYACDKHLAALPGSTDWSLYSAQQLCELGRCPQGITRALETLSGQGNKRANDERVAEFKVLWTGFRNMGLGPELLQVIAANSRQNLPEEWMAASALSSESLGRPDIALKLHTELFRQHASEHFHSTSAAEIIRLYLVTGQEDKATAFIERLTPEEAAKALSWVSFFRFRWPGARPILAELVRIALRYDKISPDTLGDALVTLTMQPRPNLAELDSVLARIRTMAASRPATEPDEQEDSDDSVLPGQVIVAMARGEYDAAAKLIDQADPKTMIPDAVRNAIAFLKTNAPTLTGDREPWRQTTAAYPLKAGGYILFTREQRLGYASPDATTIRDIPPPQKQWQGLANMDPILNAQGDNGILTTNGDTIFLLDADRSTWTPLARLPEHYAGWNLEAISKSLDNLIPLLRSRSDAPVRIVEPESLFAAGVRMTSLMLSDGTWLCCDTRTGKVWQPRPLASQVMGETVDIYSVHTPIRDDGNVFVYTSRGLLEWRPEEGAMKRIALPGVDKPFPVTPTYEGAWPPEGTIRAALFPEAGGTTFLIETATARATREGCINEACPLNYWRQKPADVKRELLSKGLRDAGLKYPWGSSEPPS